MKSSDNGDHVDHTDSTKPYLIRAIHEWALDNGFTPQMLVMTHHKEVVVPQEHVTDDQIVLNIHPQSVKNLGLGNEYITCSARFSGNPFEITVPIYSVQAIYARENGQGVVFNAVDNVPPPQSPEPENAKGKKNTGDKKSSGNNDHNASHLKVIK